MTSEIIGLKIAMTSIALIIIYLNIKKDKDKDKFLNE
tara:strand:- start:535 stop:645 length:111 start_codon:yes stop_codon:yes gene_type:complete